MSWFRRLWPAPSRPPVPQVAPTLPTLPAAPAAASPAGDPPDAPHRTLPWLLGFGELVQDDATVGERELLGLIDQTLAEPVFPDRLLPRAAHLIPQLIALLRQSELPSGEMATRITRDALLSAEVMRLSNSPYYRGQDPVRDLEQAVRRIGEWGLQQVIARVILKPIYQGTPGLWGARAAPRQWDLAETLARHASLLAPDAGQAPFDAYLAGMLHGTGWTIALNLADRAGLALHPTPTLVLADALDDRVHRLFGHAAQRWDITPGFTAFTRAACRNGSADLSHGLSAVLRGAQQPCMQDLMAR